MDFSQVKLKKAAPPKEQVAISPALCEDEVQYQKMMEESYIENYLKEIQQFTFRTSVIPLVPPVALAIRDAHKDSQKGRLEDSYFDTNEPLLSLAHQIKVEMDKLGVPTVFVRLSSRSPKDAFMTSPAFPVLLTQHHHRIKQENTKYASNPSTPHNDKLVALYWASTQAMASINGLEAIRFLASSDRIQEDLAIAAGGQVPFNVIVRQFSTFDVEYEFRAFYFDNKMTGLTQYNEYVYFPSLPAKKAKILQKIKDFSEKNVVGKFSMKNFVVDYVLVPRDNDNFKFNQDIDELNVFVVELNPLAEFAGGGLFDWVKDKQVLTGQSAFEFRIAEKSPPFVLANLAPAFQQVFQQLEQ